jgi:hypothetical protein
MSRASDILTELSAHPARDALAARVRNVALQAATEERRDFLRASANPGSEPELSAEQGETRYGNVLTILAEGAKGPEQADLIAVLLALGVAPDFPSAPETELARAKELVFLAAHTPVDAISAGSVVLGPERTRPLWRAVARLADPAETPERRAEALVAAALLAGDESEAAIAARTDAARDARDRLAKILLTPRAENGATRLAGELSPAPHGPVVTALLALTGILFLWRAVRLVGALALAFKQPAEIRLSDRGLEIAHKTELLGRVLRAKETVVPIANLARITREIRYNRLGLYLGLFALTLGSYFGMSLLVDGVRVPGGSAPLLGLGLVIVVLGLAIDYGLTTLADTVRGRCRVVVVPKKGKSVCVGSLEPRHVDAMLAELSIRAAR